MQVLIKTKSGNKELTMERVRSLVDAGTLPPDAQVASMDGGKTWITVKEVLLHDRLQNANEEVEAAGAESRPDEKREAEADYTIPKRRTVWEIEEAASKSLASKQPSATDGSGLAVASLVCGMVGLLLVLIPLSFFVIAAISQFLPAIVVIYAAIPLVSFLGIILGALAIAFKIISPSIWYRKTALFGCICGILAILLSIGSTAWIVYSMTSKDKKDEDAPRSRQRW